MLEEILNGDTDLAIFFSFAITTQAFLLYVLMQRIRNKKENQQKRFIKIMGYDNLSMYKNRLKNCYESKNKYAIRCRISEKKFREIIRYFHLT